MFPKLWNGYNPHDSYLPITAPEDRKLCYPYEVSPRNLTLFADSSRGEVARRLSNVCNSLPFFEDLESPSQSFQTQEIISVGRDINLVKHNVRGPLGLHIALFLAYDLLLWSLKQAKKRLVSYRIYFFSAITTQECYNHSKEKTTVFHGRPL